MEPVLIAVVVLQAIVLAAAGVIAVRQRTKLEDLRAALGRPAVNDGLTHSVRSLVEQATTLERELDVQRRELAHLADVVGVGIVRLDDDLRVDMANGTAHVLLDRAPGTLQGLSAIEAFVDGRVEQIVANARASGAASGEVTVRDGDGATVIVRARRSPARGLWVVIEDVSELRRLRQIRAEFIDNLSHELRTPITTVSLLAETLSRDVEGAGDSVPERMRERIAKIEVETGHLVQMVNELLDLSRIESGAGLMHLDDVDLGRIAAASAERLRLFADRQNVRLEVAVDDGLPRVRGEESRLGQVFVNLVHNAVKFSPDGGAVRIVVRREGDELVASVEDEGIGIPESSLARVFERFYKVDRARLRGGGTGLGLSIARHIVEQHGGRIWAHSEEGRGAIFSFTVPIAADAIRFDASNRS